MVKGPREPKELIVIDMDFSLQHGGGVVLILCRVMTNVALRLTVNVCCEHH